jgi:hypothetical protein
MDLINYDDLKFQTKQRSKEEQRWYNSQMNRDIVADASRGKTTQAQRAVDIPEAGNTRANTADTESRSPQKVKPQWTREQWQEYQHQYGSIIHALFEFDFQCSVICFRCRPKCQSCHSEILNDSLNNFTTRYRKEHPRTDAEWADWSKRNNNKPRWTQDEWDAWKRQQEMEQNAAKAVKV